MSGQRPSRLAATAARTFPLIAAAAFALASCDGKKSPAAGSPPAPATPGTSKSDAGTPPLVPADPPAGGPDAAPPSPLPGADAAAPSVDAPTSETAAPDAIAEVGTPSGPLPGRKVLDRVRINSHSKEPNFQRARGPLELGPGPFSSVRVTVELDSSCFPFQRWREDPPPMGQNWPPKCDAFDRRFEITLNPPATPEGKPGIELVRAMTPFGGPMRFEADITDVINGLPGPHVLEAYIDTWSDAAGKVTGSQGGWFVSASVEAIAGPAPREVLAVVPLYYDSQRQSKVGPLAFTVPAGAGKTRIEYRASGHTLEGGPSDPACIGPPEEFCRRRHVLTLDDQQVDNIDAWRTNCAELCTVTTAPGPSGRNLMFCQQNPCGAIQSVRAPRANWCPGSVTPPRVIERMLPPGEHRFGWDISPLQSGGMWRISATAIVYR